MQGSYAQIAVKGLAGYSLLEAAPDEDALLAKALALSRERQTLALAILNQDDTRLVLAAYQNGEWLEYYDSNPLYLGCRVCSYAEVSINTEGGNAENWARLFGVPAKAKKLQHWLVRKRGLGFLYEHERLAAIAEILGISLNPSLSLSRGTESKS